MKVPAAFDAVLRLAVARNVTRIDQIAGCWEPEIPDGWQVAVNGHNEAMAPTWTPAAVPPFHLFAARDLVILCVGPGGGSYAGDPAAEDDFIASVEKAIAGAADA